MGKCVITVKIGSDGRSIREKERRNEEKRKNGERKRNHLNKGEVNPLYPGKNQRVEEDRT
jgi:hypothetical protein